MRLAIALPLALLVVSCQRPIPAPHYVLGEPYQADGVWYYPRESYDYHETGLATVYAPGHATLTADGEVFDQSALAAAHQTLQLPAIASLTNLDNGRQVLVRINDRGPPSPQRLVEVTRRTATLLGFPAGGVARVRLAVLPEMSQAAVEAVAGAPKLSIVAAPIGAVQQSNLPPLGGTPGAVTPATPAAPQTPAQTAAAPVLRLPETLTQVTPDPGRLFVRLSTFQSYEYANIQRARVAGLGAQVVAVVEGGAQVYRVMAGPFTTVSQADMVLDQVLRAGVTDARIVVE